MATDRSLATLLRALHNPTGAQDASRLLGSATALYTLLSNPLNVTLLTSQLLSAPAIWHAPDGLRTPFRVLGAFNAASLQLLHRETEPRQDPGGHPAPQRLAKEDWVRAVIRGADDRTPRWRHLLVLGGLLTGFESHGRQGLPDALRRTLEGAVVDAANLALQDTTHEDGLASGTTCLVLGHCLDLLDGFQKGRIESDRLLPRLVHELLFGHEGLERGYFVSMMDGDLRQNAADRFDWSTKSASFKHVQRLAAGPLVSALGPLSRLAATCVENVRHVDRLFLMTEAITEFTRTLCLQWRQNKLSELDPSEESVFLTEETLRLSLPLLWQVLKSTVFAIVGIQRSLLGRVLGDGRIAKAPSIAIQTLHALRNIHFISSRLGLDAFSQYTFVYMACVDILSGYPAQAEAFLEEIGPRQSERMAEHPHDRCRDLFFLNAAEHFTLVLAPEPNERLLLRAAGPYLDPAGDARLLEIFEAAHSVVLAVFSAPGNYEVTTKQLPAYVSTLFRVFPTHLSARQFRLAVKTLVRIASPPSLISEDQPLLSSSLLEMVRHRSLDAPTRPPAPLPKQAPADGTQALSEQAVMVLSLIDSLPALPTDALLEWLPLTAEAMNRIREGPFLGACRARFWEVLSNGEMDVARAETCVTWWNTRDGRTAVLEGARPHVGGPFMSGALQETSKL